MTDKPASQDRRALLAAGGKTALLLSLPAALSACLRAEDNVTRSVNGVTQIQIRTGMNCWDGQCFRYNRFASVPGREPVAVPEDIEMVDGFVTEDEFARILAAARQAPREQGGGGNGNGGAGGGGRTGGAADPAGDDGVDAGGIVSGGSQ